MWTVVQHFKGNYYLTLGDAKSSEDQERLVVYLSLYPNESSSLWVRPKEMFESLMPPGTQRFEPKFMIRKAAPSDIPELLSFGYDAWGEGESMSSFIESYEKDRNHLRGQRYLIETLSGETLANLNAILLSRNVIGIASVATKPEVRRNGHAARLLNAVMELLKLENPNYTFMLFSEISLSYYQKLGFKALPASYQKFSPSVAMSNGKRDLTEEELVLMDKYF
jgi:ribosomal protein S18 acetylase RimI-like enzyme